MQWGNVVASTKHYVSENKIEALELAVGKMAP